MRLLIIIAFTVVGSSASLLNQNLFAATYEISFQGTWSEADVTPGSYPRSAHFTTIIGTSHQQGSEFWRNGDVASRGVEAVAEVGATGTLAAEIANARQAGLAGQTITLDSQFNLPQTSTAQIEVDDDKAFLTLITMIAPSPDWFVGVSALALRENGQWRPNITADLRAYDAGTEEGNTFSLANPATVGGRISRLAEGDSPFVGQPVIARLSLRLLEPLTPVDPPEPPSEPPANPPVSSSDLKNLSSVISLLLDDNE